MKRSVATQFVPIIGSRSCAVLSPIAKEEIRAAALFQRTSSFVSWVAKVRAASFTESRSLRSRWRNLMVPGVEGAGDEVVREWIAVSAFDWEKVSVVGWRMGGKGGPWIERPCRLLLRCRRGS